MATTLEQASGRWPELLMALGGLSPEQLTDTHQPCPACGGTDRYRWDRDDGPGGCYCNQCGGKDQAGGGMSGLDLLLRVTGWDLKQAIRRVRAHLDPTAPTTDTPAPARKPRRPARIPDHPPAGTPPPDLGRATAQWPYFTADNLDQPAFWIQRVDTDKGKLFIHRTWLDGRWHYPSRRDTFTSEWPAPRPLYRLPDLVARPDAPVLITEGEKSADAGAELLPDHVAIAWCGGTGGVNHVDWSPLAGRTVVLWPDNDDPGRQAMAKLGQRLLGLGCSVSIFNPPEGCPAKWDLADAIAESKWETSHIKHLIKKHARELPVLEPNPEAPAPPTPPPPNPVPALPSNAPFTVLGWEPGEDRRYVWVQAGPHASIVRIPTNKQGLQTIAPISYWEALHPTRTGGVAWDAAISSFIHSHADQAGWFRPSALRGRGVWRDGDAVVWNLGDRLMVNGTPQAFDWRGADSHVYQSGERLPIDPNGPALTDQEGAAIFSLYLKEMPWEASIHGALFVGHAVMAAIGGAMKYRPAMQVSTHTQGGKTTLMEGSYLPLLGAASKDSKLVLFQSKSTAAGITQCLKSDSLPVFIDESEEGEEAGKRAGHILLARLSFDGTTLSKGTSAGVPLGYVMRSSVALAGINAPIPNPADRSRFIVVQPKRDEKLFARFKQSRDALITPETGRRLVRRTVRHLMRLQENIDVITALMLDCGRVSSRQADVYGTVLGCAHSIISTQLLTKESALAWLDLIGWTGPGEEEQDDSAHDREATDCRDRLLGYMVPWQEKGSPTRDATVERLLWLVMTDSTHAAEARQSLGALGIKWAEGRVIVARRCSVFNGSRWGSGAHLQQLLMLEGAERTPERTRFAGLGHHRGVRFPFTPSGPADN
ncbi:MAG: primase-helicase zinc-binding domain-containing protein [Synechococcaceae cyanobacterium]|nr:primase-helicase zinc-binding domain-containing protein [Synechococcaceae cyanobacterium]